MGKPVRIAFYDLDGTLVSSNIVTRYAFLVRRLPSTPTACWKYLRLIASVPSYLALNYYSRRVFNETFFREYRGISQEWLEQIASQLFEQVVSPSVYPGAGALLAADRSEGFRLALVTGELDILLEPVVRYFGFDHWISNRLIFQNGVATGEVMRPLVAEGEKVRAMAKACHQMGAELSHCKAYSDSFSDTPMLEACGNPVAVNPDRRQNKTAAQRGWPILDLRASRGSSARRERGHDVS